MLSYFTKTTLLLLLLCVSSIAQAQPANPLFEELTAKGVVLAKGPALKLPRPTMPDGLDAAAQRKALETIPDGEGKLTGEKLTAFLRKAVVSPFVLKITDDKDSIAAGGTGRRVDLWFVAYGDLKKAADEGFWSRDGEKKDGKSEAKADDGGTDATGKVLKPEELAERHIEPATSGDFTERFGAAGFTLFDRVRIHGTTRTIQTESDDSFTVTTLLDPRFTKDKKYPNQWQSINRDDAGKLTLGPPQPYTGAGAYGKATQLKEPAGAILVEYHIVFDEPQGWFNGANLLRSKLPIVVQDNVRKLRRKLAEKQ